MWQRLLGLLSIECLMRYNKKVKTYTVQDVYDKYKVSEKDILYYTSLIDKVGEERALDLFIEKYMIKPVHDYNIIMEEFMGIADQGELPQAEKLKTERNISLLSFGLLSLLSENFEKLSKKIFSPIIFNERKITSKKVQKAILDSTLGNFKAFTSVCKVKFVGA